MSRPTAVATWLVPAMATMALVAPSIAQATSYCVQAEACVKAGGTEVKAGSPGEILQKALAEAKTGGPNRVVVGPGTYARTGGFSYTGAANTTIEGAGEGATVLTRDAAESTTVVTLDANAILSGATIEVPLARDAGAIALGGGTASAVHIESPESSPAYGLRLEGGKLLQSIVEARGVAVSVSGSTPGEIADCTLVGISDVEDTAPVTIRRSRLSASSFALEIYHTEAAIEDTLIDLQGVASTAGIYVNGDALGNARVTVHNATIVNGGSASAGIWLDPNDGKESRAAVYDSIIAAVQRPLYQRPEEAGSKTAVTTHYSSYEAAKDVRAASGGASEPPEVEDLNPASATPGFVKEVTGSKGFGEGNWRLAPTSPLIDKGTPGSLAPDESSTDLAANPRLVDGHRDVGAYEYQSTAPTVTATAIPAHLVVGEVIAFSGTAVDSEPGDAIASYQWAFDDGAAVPAGASASHAFVSPGVHTATLTATDLAGAKGAEVLTFAVEARPAAPGSTSPSAHPQTAWAPPTLSGLAVRPGAFKVLAHRHGGGVISFTLSEPAALMLTVQALEPGSRHGHVCVPLHAPSSRRHSCVRHVLERGAIRLSAGAGKGTYRFSGLIGGRELRPGRYLLVVVATDAAGHASAHPATAVFRVTG